MERIKLLRKNKNKRLYNKKIYNAFKKGNGYVRDKITPDPLNQLNEYGIFGKVVNKIGNKILKKPIHKLTRSLVGNIYDFKKEKPYKGSILYTIIKVGVCLTVSLIFCGILRVIE
ncbi:MAG: hypothetical protein II984_05380 [Clostridia bacterium]|nr:hypothetical protein [Clostridia bacterium]